MATFTLPQDLRQLTHSRKKVLCDMIFHASQQALRKPAAYPKYIGDTIDMIGVLQTWTRDLRCRPHVHYLISVGGLGREYHCRRQWQGSLEVPISLRLPRRYQQSKHPRPQERMRYIPPAP